MFPNGMDARQVEVELRVGHGFGVWIQGELAGYILCRDSEDLLEVTRIAVLPSYQRRGVGQALLEMMLRDIDPPTNGYLTLHVQKGNRSAIHLYLRNGLHIVGEDGNSWVMQRALGDHGEADALFLKVR